MGKAYKTGTCRVCGLPFVQRVEDDFDTCDDCEDTGENDWYQNEQVLDESHSDADMGL